MTLILVNKPKGATSHDVVNKIRRITGEKRVGHGGTLDPNATGLLVVGVGRQSTRQLGNISKGLDKTYIAEIILGENSSTDDSEGEIIKVNSAKPDEKKIRELLKKSLGQSMQKPPAFSAIKLEGKKAYEEARRGKPLDLPLRPVTIYELKLLNYNYPILEISCKVSSGTYIRALARDIGLALKTGAYLNNLTRTEIGDYKVEDALTLEELEKSWKS